MYAGNRYRTYYKYIQRGIQPHQITHDCVIKTAKKNVRQVTKKRKKKKKPIARANNPLKSELIIRDDYFRFMDRKERVERK